MTEPDEALIWARERAKADWLECDDETGTLHAAAEDFPSGDSDHFEDIEWRAEAYRAGQAASAERIKALEHDLMWTDRAWEAAQEAVVYGYALMDKQDVRIKALEGLLREIKPVAHMFQWNDLGDQIDTLLKEADR
jgi:hypothetical protein